MQVSVFRHRDGTITAIERKLDKSYVVRDFDAEGRQIGSNDNHGSAASYRELYDTVRRDGDPEVENYKGFESFEEILQQHVAPTSFGYDEPD